MKKTILALASILATSFGAFADTTLAEAYDGLSRLSGMSEKRVDKAQISGNATISNLKTSVVNVNQSNVQNYRDNFIYMMENLPVRNMVIGANNQRELAAVYATPAGNGLYNILIVKGDVLDGNFSTSYGQTNIAGVNAIKNCNVTMDSSELIFSPANYDSSNILSMTE